MIGLLCAAVAGVVAAVAISSGRAVTATPESASRPGQMVGVAACDGSVCHSRTVSSGPVVRQNERITWEESGPAGAHRRAFDVLRRPRGRAILQRMGLGAPEQATACLGCHSDAAVGSPRVLSDGVTCEGCHGAAGGWVATHYTLKGAGEAGRISAAHADSVRRGMVELDRPAVAASVCLDCHYGSQKRGQFVTHEMMAAGHPRISFELSLFNDMQRHWNVDDDYCGTTPNSRRKVCARGVTTWAVGQALAVERELKLFVSDKANFGAYPEFYFFDCHSCHRPISDADSFQPTAVRNPGRDGLKAGSPPFNDENMIMLAAAARVRSAALARQLEANTAAFHNAFTPGRGNRAAVVQAANRLAATAAQLAAEFNRRDFTREETIQIVNTIVGNELAGRYTDYAGSAQAVMAVRALVSSMVASGDIDRDRGTQVVRALDGAYAQVRNPNQYRPEAFRRALAESVRGLR